MTLLGFHRPISRSAVQAARMALLGVVLVLAQLGIAMHPLHGAVKQDGQNVETSCAFCIAGTHLEAAPAAPSVHLQTFAPVLDDADVRHVCEARSLITPRLTRGPPKSTSCV